MAKIDLRTELTFSVEEEDGQFTSYCPELDVASCGDTPDEALENIREAVDVHLEGLREIGVCKVPLHGTVAEDLYLPSGVEPDSDVQINQATNVVWLSGAVPGGGNNINWHVNDEEGDDLSPLQHRHLILQ